LKSFLFMRTSANPPLCIKVHQQYNCSSMWEAKYRPPIYQFDTKNNQKVTGIMCLEKIKSSFKLYAM
jgi:hypothetical protein